MGKQSSVFTARLRLWPLLDRLSLIDDTRHANRLVYLLADIIILTVCDAIGDCDNWEDISDWDEQHLEFMRRHSAIHYGLRADAGSPLL